LVAIVAIVGGQYVINRTTFADRLIAPLLMPDSVSPADAIVVMGAGVIGDCGTNQNGVRRVLLAARLWRQKLAPVVVFTGGQAESGCPVAVAMARLAEEVGVARSSIITESMSASTRENGEFSAPLLRARGFRRLLIVTDRLHMRRSSSTFTTLGFEVRRASVPIYEGHATNVQMLSAGIREAVALLYYKMRGWIGTPPPG
jgi:uncharacterized SAM-binding protein YcdF (DUF218 family)